MVMHDCLVASSSWEERVNGELFKEKRHGGSLVRVYIWKEFRIVGKSVSWGKIKWCQVFHFSKRHIRLDYLLWQMFVGGKCISDRTNNIRQDLGSEKRKTELAKGSRNVYWLGRLTQWALPAGQWNVHISALKFLDWVQELTEVILQLAWAKWRGKSPQPLLQGQVVF